MTANGYAVFFFPPALEALGEAIKPYLQEGPAGPHVLCNEIDTAGSLLEMTLFGNNSEGSTVQVDLMVPTSMVRMIVSSQSDNDFGFGPRPAPQAAVPDLPPVGPTAPPAEAAPEAVPGGGAASTPATTEPDPVGAGSGSRAAGKGKSADKKGADMGATSKKGAGKRRAGRKAPK